MFPRILSISLFFFLGVTIISAQDSLRSVLAKKGDGILSMLRAEGVDPVKYYPDFLALNKDNIREGSQLDAGKYYLIPHVSDSLLVMGSVIDELNGKHYSIFGKEMAFVPNKSERLTGTVYYLISGHGGPDPGAIENHGGKIIAEDEYAYDVTLRLARELLSHGAKVFIIVRDEDDGIRDQRTLEIDRDEVVYPDKKIPRGQLDRLKQRVEAVNKLYLQHTGRYQRLIVTHVDSRSEGENIDVFFYHHKKSEKGKALAESIHDTFRTKYKKYQPNRDYFGTFSDRSSLYMVKNTLPAMAYIEIGNIRNEKDQRRILDPDNRQALAKWIAEGALADYENQSD